MIAADAFSAAETASEKPCALLWDESFLWGIMARRALLEAGLSFDLVGTGGSTGGTVTGCCSFRAAGHRASAAAGDAGMRQIRRFVEAGETTSGSAAAPDWPHGMKSRFCPSAGSHRPGG